MPKPDDMPLHHRVAWECGWCDEWISGFTSIDVHVRLLWHQWWNHRQNIREEY